MSGNWVPEDYPGEGLGNVDILDEQGGPIVARQSVLENEQGEKLLLRVRGLDQAVTEYMESIEGRIAFYVGDEVFPSDPSGDIVEATDVGDDLLSLDIVFELLGHDEPTPLAIWIDPIFNAVIGNHVHNYYLCGWFSVTIHADAGSLTMTLGGLMVRVGPGNTSGTLANQDNCFRITVAGAPGSQYDLYFKVR